MSGESNYVREKLGAIQATLESIENKLDSGTKRMDGFENRIRKIEDWKLGIITIVAFIGTVVGFVGKYVFEKIIGRS